MNIDEMPAGRALDALVAERVMGLELNKSNSNVPIFLTPKLSWSLVPHYSTDIAAAWEIVEKLRAGGIYFTIRTDTIWDVTVWNGNEGTWTMNGCCQDKWLVDVQAKTAPLAICRAALKAIRSLGPGLATAILPSLPGALEGKLGASNE